MNTHTWSPALKRLWRPQLGLGIVLGLALLLRLSLLAADRLTVDEALYSSWGLLIASGRDPLLRSVIVLKPPVFPYVQALFFWIFGQTEAAARLPNLIAGVASIALLYEIARRLYDERVALLSALLLAFSPFHILFSPTAFTDPLMVTLLLASGLAALAGRFGRSGLAFGLAFFTKPQAVLYAPLLLLLALRARRRSGGGRPWAAALRLGLGLAVPLAAYLVWDGLLRPDAVNVFSAVTSRYVVSPAAGSGDALRRLAAWIEMLKAGTGSPLLNTLLAAGLPVLLAYDLWRRRDGVGWLCDWALALFCLLFLAVNAGLTFLVADRYLLGLVPLLAVLLARLLLLPHDALGRWSGGRRPAAAYAALGCLVLCLVLPGPARRALRHDYPIAGEQGAYRGIENLAGYLRGNAPPGSILFERRLAWHLSFYLFGAPLEMQHYESAADLLSLAEQHPGRSLFLVLPAWGDAGGLHRALGSAGWRLRDLYTTYRPDGTASFNLFRVEMGDGL